MILPPTMLLNDVSFTKHCFTLIVPLLYLICE